MNQKGKIPDSMATIDANRRVEDLGIKRVAVLFFYFIMAIVPESPSGTLVQKVAGGA
jgi:hypothetical protein